MFVASDSAETCHCCFRARASAGELRVLWTELAPQKLDGRVPRCRRPKAGNLPAACGWLRGGLVCLPGGCMCSAVRNDSTLAPTPFTCRQAATVRRKGQSQTCRSARVLDLVAVKNVSIVCARGRKARDVLSGHPPRLLHDPGERTIQSGGFSGDLLESRSRKVDALFSFVGVAHVKCAKLSRWPRGRQGLVKLSDALLDCDGRCHGQLDESTPFSPSSALSFAYPTDLGSYQE